jgi:hypothetical protein
MENSTAHFATSSLKVFPMILLNAFLLPRHSCSFKSWTLIPLQPPWAHPLFILEHLSLGAFLATLSLPGPWRPCPLHGTGMVQWVIPLWTAANFFWYPPLLWVHFFSCRWHPVARWQSPYCSFSALTIFTTSFSVGTFSCTTMDSYLHWGWLITLQTGLHHFLAGHHLFSPGFHFF